MKSPATERLYQVEDELRAAERRIAEMKAERDDAWNSVQRKQEYVEDVNATIESWIEAFEMTLGDDGMWHSSGETPHRQVSFTNREAQCAGEGVEQARSRIQRHGCAKADRATAQRL